MSLYRDMALLAVRQFLGDRADSMLRFMSDRFGDHGRRLDAALRKANERAWRTLEVALAGRSWWDACTGLLSPRDEKALQAHVRTFLDGLPPDERAGGTAAFRARALAELQAARQAGLVPGPDLSGQELTDEVRVFARYSDPRQLVERDHRAVAGMADTLRGAGFADLATYVSLRPGEGQPLLVQAVRFFFRREVEGDPQLSAGLTTDRLESFDANLASGLQALHGALEQHDSRLAELLGGVATVVQKTHDRVQKVHSTTSDTLEVVRDTSEEVKSLHARMEHQQAQIHQLTDLLRQVLGQRDAAMNPVPTPSVVTPPASAPTPAGNGTDDWKEVHRLLNRVQRLSPEEQQRRPELNRVVHDLTAAARAFETTRRTYLHLRQPSSDPLPVYPPESPIFDALPANESPRRSASGRLISDLFQPKTTPPAEESAQSPPPDPPRRRLSSSLFDRHAEPAGQVESKEPTPAAEPSPPETPPRRRLYSSLFDPANRPTGDDEKGK